MQRKTKEEIFVDTGIKNGLLRADSKEELLREIVQDRPGPEGESMFESMQEYADQEMEKFALWLQKNHFIHALHKPGHWLVNMPNSNPPGKPLPTTQELIALYKKEVENGTH